MAMPTNLVDILIKGQDPIMDTTTLQECGLECVCEVFHYRCQTHLTNLHKNLLEHINHRNRPKVSDIRRTNY